MNKIIKILILSDLALIAGYGFYLPIFAIFIANQIEGGDVRVAGFVSAIYWIVYSFVVIPFGRYLDKNHGDKDDLWFIVIGNMISALAVFSYIFAYLPWHTYVLQAVYAFGLGMNMPAFTALFTRHIDKGKEAFDWGVRGALIGLGTGVSGALGGIIADKWGFDTLFLSVSIFIAVSSLLPLLIRRDIIPKSSKKLKIVVAKGVQPAQTKE